MNILFMSLGEFGDLSAGSVHIDVLRELSKNNNVYLVCKNEKRNQQPTTYTLEYGIHVLRVKTGNVKKTNIVKKGVSTLLVEPQFKKAIKKHLGKVHFDAVIYTTPPITFVSPIKYIKSKDNALTYLMLKDIFPQNAVDLGMMKKDGVKSVIYKRFRKKEKDLYKCTDIIGCMSPANIDYIVANNPELGNKKIELFPNCINVRDISLDKDEKRAIRAKYGIPLDKTIFVYGGNLGKPQGIEFIKRCIASERDNEKAFFVIVGGGTEYDNLERHIKTNGLENVKLMSSLPKEEYEQFVSACDVGMIFLDHRFTIPNFPARTLSYMQSKLPILAATDPNTDVGTIIRDNGFGWWVESNDIEEFKNAVNVAINSDLNIMGEKGYDYLINNHEVSLWCNRLMNELEEEIKNRR